MPFIRVRDLEMRTYCPPRKRGIRDKLPSTKFCPSCVLPIVVAFILVFTVSQLIVIHRTIEAYKRRNRAFDECYGIHPNDSKILVDLAFSKNFAPIWPNASVEWKAAQPYPYRLQVQHPTDIENIWKSDCPEKSTNLRGNVSKELNWNITVDDILQENPGVQSGGEWSPSECSARHKVAVVIPYRDRWKHLTNLLAILHPMLQRQMLSYRIFIVEQYGNYTFNKGVLMNAAFLLAMNTSTFDCVIFHDVDLLPQDDRNIYGCGPNPLHLSVAIDTLDYRLPYASLVGGVFGIKVEHFIRVNGYSNLYWGWGAEDDDMFNRLAANQLKVTRPSASTARYKMLEHGRRLPNQFITPLIRTARIRYTKDGLTTCKFRLVNAQVEPLFTHFLVDVGQPSYFVQMKLSEETALSNKHRK